MSRANKALADARVADLLRIMLDGAESWDLCEFVREKAKEEGSCWFVGPGGKPLSYSQIRRYAARAEKLMGESCRASRKRLMRRHLAQRRNLFAKAVSSGDYRAALACLADEAKLLRLYEDAPAAASATPPAVANAGDVVKLLAEQLARLQGAKLTEAERARLTSQVAAAYSQVVTTHEIKQQIAELQELARERERLDSPAKGRR